MSLRARNGFAAFLGLCTLTAACVIAVSAYWRHQRNNIREARAVTTVVKTSRSIDDVLCSGIRPIFKCRGNSTPSPEEVRLWPYRLAEDEDFSRYEQLSSSKESCALVGSSYNLMKNEFGAEIDSHDLVVRLNDPPVKGYEKHVGARPADISIFNFVIAQTRCAEPPRNGSLMVQCSFSPDSTSRARANTQCVESMWRKYQSKTFIMSDYVFGAAERALAYSPVRSTKATLNKYRPTCGLRSIMFLLGLCQNLDLYGFGGTMDQEPYKYYSDLKTERMYKSKSHDFVGESHFIDDFAKSVLNLTAFGLSWNGKFIVHR